MSTDKYAHHVSYRIEAGWGRANKEQSAVLLLFAISCIPAFFIARSWGVIASGVVCFLLYAPMYGKEKLAGINTIQLRLEQRRFRKRGGNFFTRDLSDTLLRYDEGTHSLQALPKRSQQPVSVLSFQPAGRDYYLAFFRRKEKRQDDLVAIVLFDGAPSVVNAEMASRFFKDARIVQAYKKALGTTLQQLSFSQFVMRRPANMMEPIIHAERRWHPDFYAPEPGSGEAALRDMAFEENDATYREGALYRLGVAFRMEFPKEWRGKDLSSLTEAEVRSVDFMKVVDTFISSVSSLSTRPRLPTLFELNELGFLLYNAVPEDLLPFFAQMNEDMVRDEAGEFNNVEDAPTLKRGPLPAHLSLHHDHLLANRTYHTSLLVTEAENGEFAPGYLDYLFMSGMPFVYSQLVHTEDYLKSVKSARRRRTGVAFFSGLFSPGKSNDPDINLEDAEREELARAEHHQLYYSRSRATLSRVQVTLQGGSCEETQMRAHKMSAQLLQYLCTNHQALGADEHHQHEPLLMHFCLGREM